MRSRSGRALVPALVALLFAGHAPACGFEGDDVSLRRGAMNWSYPDSLHVLSAVWSAQRTGLLERLPGFDDPAPPSPAALRLAQIRVSSRLSKLRTRLAAAMPAGAPPALSIVLLEPMLWSRIAVDGDALRLTVHVDSAAPGDVVVVTEEPVVAALADGGLSGHDALALGLIRVYGQSEDVAAARRWIEATGVGVPEAAPNPA